MGPNSDLRPTGSFVRAQVGDGRVQDLIDWIGDHMNSTFQAGGLISVLPTTGINLDSLYPPAKGGISLEILQLMSMTQPTTTS